VDGIETGRKRDAVGYGGGQSKVLQFREDPVKNGALVGGQPEGKGTGRLEGKRNTCSVCLGQLGGEKKGSKGTPPDLSIGPIKKVLSGFGDELKGGG